MKSILSPLACRCAALGTLLALTGVSAMAIGPPSTASATSNETCGSSTSSTSGEGGEGPPDLAQEAGGSLAKRRRTQPESKKPDEPESSLPSGESSLASLPFELLEHIASFEPTGFRRVSAPLDRIASRAVHRLEIKVDISDGQLLALVTARPWLRSLSLDLNLLPSLSAIGILNALALAPELEKLSILGTDPLFFNNDQLLTIPRTHPKLQDVELCSMVTADFLWEFEGRLKSLHLLRGDLINEADFLALQGLKNLQVSRCPSFRGRQLPDSVTTLVVSLCDGFDGVGLAPSLSDLTIKSCNDFYGISSVSRLQTLRVVSCRNFMGFGVDIPTLKNLIVHGCASFSGRLPSGIEYLTVVDCAIFHDFMVPAATRHLTVNNCPIFIGAFSFPTLRSLAIANQNNFIFDYLPRKLEMLSVENVLNFTGKLPIGILIEELTVVSCPLFTDEPGFPSHIKRLSVKRCERFRPGNLAP